MTSDFSTAAAPPPETNVFVTLILTESAANVLSLGSVPRVEQVAVKQCGEDTAGESIYILQSLTSDIVVESMTTRLLEYLFGASQNAETSVGGVSDKVVADVAFYISGDFRSDSEVSLDVDNEDEYANNISADLQQILLPLKIYNRPILMAKSAAHKDHLTSVGKNLHISVFGSELSLNTSNWSNMCRICHGGESMGNLLQPCKCKGSVAYTHLTCLERWLRESSYNQCELCKHHYEIIREPKYSIPYSILVFLRHPGEHFKELLVDTFAFLVYTPSALISTYMLMLICESATKTNIKDQDVQSHVIALSAIFGMAAIDFTYSSWLIMCLQRHTDAWRLWYRNNCQLRLILPQEKKNGIKRNKKQTDILLHRENELD